jgi:hypothetical protein
MRREETAEGKSTGMSIETKLIGFRGALVTADCVCARSKGACREPRAHGYLLREERNSRDEPCCKLVLE